MDDGGLPSLNARVAILGQPLWRARLAKRLLAWPGLSLHVLGASGDDLSELFDTAPADRFFLHHLVPTEVRSRAGHIQIVGPSGQELEADLVVASEAGDSRVITPRTAEARSTSAAENADELADEVIEVLLGQSGARTTD